MSRLNDLLRRLEATDPALAKDLRQEYDALADRRAFGLNFERHTPEVVELPGRKVRRGDKVHVLPERGQNPTAENSRLWRVVAIDRNGESPTVSLEALEALEGDLAETSDAPLEDVVVAAEFRDPIYPGLVSTGRVERGGDKPFHTVINAENYHALQTLLFTHRGKVDCIYIDPPYNTGNEGWIYNDKYVAGDDHYKHSKWLAFMERRLLIARELLSERGFILVSIDDAEQARLHLLMDQVFGHGRHQATFVWRTDGNLDNQAVLKTNHEYVLMFAKNQGRTRISGVKDPNTPEDSKLFNSEIRNSVVKNGPKNPPSTIVLEPGFPANFSEGVVPARTDKYPSYDIDLVIENGRLQNRVQATTGWASGKMLRQFIAIGFEPLIDSKGQETAFELTSTGAIENVKKRRGGQHHILSVLMNMGTVETAGNALRDIGCVFPYPKPVFLLKYLLSLAPADAVILDFFGGSGTTVEAVMRLNEEDEGSRECVLVTNNELSADVASTLRADDLRPGDVEWERLGVHESVAKPRISSVATGRRSDGSSHGPGLRANVEFFNLTYGAPLLVSSNREFAAIAPLLWMRAGSTGRRIDDVSTGWDVAETYGVLADLDQTDAFVKAIAAAGESVVMAFVVTDEDRLFQTVVRELPPHVETVRLYEAYLRNFEIEAGRSAR